MENASDALIMAMAVIIFVVALTVAINAFSQAREVSELVLYTADETNYYVYEDDIEDASRNRIVGLETIIPTLYKYYKEKYSVLFLEADSYNITTGKFENPKVMTLYYSPKNFTLPSKDTQQEDGNKHVWLRSDEEYVDLVKNRYNYFVKDDNFITKTNVHSIFSFDAQEESLRAEPWYSSEEETKRNLDCFLNGEKYTLPSDGSIYIDYSSNSKAPEGNFIEKCTGKTFVESIAELTHDKMKREDEGGDGTKEVIVDTSRTNKGKKRIYIFTLVNEVKKD